MKSLLLFLCLNHMQLNQTLSNPRWFTISPLLWLTKKPFPDSRMLSSYHQSARDVHHPGDGFGSRLSWPRILHHYNVIWYSERLSPPSRFYCLTFTELQNKQHFKTALPVLKKKSPNPSSRHLLNHAYAAVTILALELSNKTAAS